MVAPGMVSVAQCENFEMTISSDNPTCPGFSDGSISVTVSGANGQVNGEISTSSGAVIPALISSNDLPAGWYYIYVYDDLGCELSDSVYLEDPDEMEVILNLTLPTSISSCDGIAEIDTVLHHIGNFEDLSFWWSGGPGGLNQTIKSDLCYGNYSVTVNNQVGCGVTKEFTVGNLAIDNSENKNAVKAFPNPVNDVLQLNADEIIQDISIFDYAGNLIWFVPGENQSELYLNMENLPSGIYFVEINCGENVERIKIALE